MRTVFDIKKKNEPLAVWHAVEDIVAERRKQKRRELAEEYRRYTEWKKKEAEREAEAQDMRIEAFHAMISVK